MAAFDPKDIRILREPTVYLLGRQTVEPSELDRFLGDHGVSTWETDTEIAGEKLAEIAGRVCYLSFARPRTWRQPGLLGPYSRSRPRVGPGTCGMELRLHRCQPFADSRVGSPSHRHGLFAAKPTLRGRIHREYVEPDVIADDPEMHALWLDAVSYTHKVYMKLVES